PFPACLAMWGVPLFHRLQKELPFALQVPLLMAMTRHRDPVGIRVPQAGLMHEAAPGKPEPAWGHGHIRNTYKRTHRWDRILRDQDELALLQREDKLLHVLFSSFPEELGLYDKPMARNVQLWTEDGQLLLDGPHATKDQIKHTLKHVEAGGTFGYRFQFPAMRVGVHEVYWHLPLLAYRNAQTGEVHEFHDGPLGYLTAYDAQSPDLEKPLEFWPRFHERDVLLQALAAFEAEGKRPEAMHMVRNIRKLVDAHELNGHKPLPHSLARQLINYRHDKGLKDWLETLPSPGLVAGMQALVEAAPTPLPRRRGAKVPDSLTYQRTARRAWEVT